MKTRISLSISMAFDFDFYIIDELSSSGDKDFREKSKSYFEKKIMNSNFIMVDRNFSNLEKFCNKAFILENGTIKLYNNVKEAIEIHKENSYKK